MFTSTRNLVSHPKIDSILSFIIVASTLGTESERSAGVEALRSLISLLRKKGCENLVRIMYEAERGELLWVLLVLQSENKMINSEIITLFSLLLNSSHVSDAYRGRLRLTGCGLGGPLLKMKTRVDADRMV
jgi:hypothetical protein